MRFPTKCLLSLDMPAALQPTRSLVPGISCESLGVDVACSNPNFADICDHAAIFEQVLPLTGR